MLGAMHVGLGTEQFRDSLHFQKLSQGFVRGNIIIGALSVVLCLLSGISHSAFM